MRDWLDDNRTIWVSCIIALLGLQILSVITASFSLHSLAKKSKSRRNESRSSSNRHLYDESDNISEFRDSL